MSTIIRNGKAYDSGDVVISMFSSLSYEVLAIEYNTEQEHQRNHSLGSNKGTSYSMGKIDHNGSITLRLASGSNIEKAAKGDLLRIKPFDINVSIVNDDNDIINDTITCKFADQGRVIDGEMDITKQHSLFILDVDYNNA